MCSPWNPASSPSRTAEATTACLHRHTGAGRCCILAWMARHSWLGSPRERPWNGVPLPHHGGAGSCTVPGTGPAVGIRLGHGRVRVRAGERGTPHRLLRVPSRDLQPHSMLSVGMIVCEAAWRALTASAGLLMPPTSQGGLSGLASCRRAPRWCASSNSASRERYSRRDRCKNVLDNAAWAAVSSHIELNTPLVGLVTV